MVSHDMRNFIRHPSDIPIEIIEGKKHYASNDNLNDIGFGGLSFCSNNILEKGSLVMVKISIVQPAFSAQAKVMWCKKNADAFDVGVEFIEKDDVFRIRMIEQVCHIQHYQKQVLAEEGRKLSGKEAALEWIQRYATNFPS